MTIPDYEVCTYCHKPMQMCSEKRDDNNVLIFRQFICACLGRPTYKNFHAGDKTKS